MNAKDSFFQVKSTLNVDGNLFSLDEPKIMGILNLTPDSFYAESRVPSEKEVLVRAENMLKDGADMLDVGGYSTRPNADDIPLEEEIKRVTPTIRALRKEFPNTMISIDTFRSQVAKAAVQEGAHLINDVAGGNLDEEMFQAVADLKTPYILMHMRGTPKTMKSLANYDDLLLEVYQELKLKCEQLKALGISDIMIDPGFGFAKTISHNYELLKNLSYFKNLGFPILIGLSRKSMIYKTLDITPEEALNGTTALHMVALQQGAKILRVHDVKEAKECVELYKQLTK